MNRAGSTGARVAATLAVLFLGACWGAEIVIGKHFVAAGERELLFPFYLAIGTVALAFVAHVVRGGRVRGLAIDGRQARVVAATSLTLVTVPYAATYFALRELSPQETSLIICTTPLVALVISTAVEQRVPHVIAVTGALVGFAGIALLLDVGGGVGRTGPVWYTIAAIAPVSYALSSFLIVRARRAGVGYLQLAFHANLVTCVVYFLAMGGEIVPATVTGGAVQLFVIAIVFNISATSLMLFAASSLPPVAITASNYSTVGFATLFSWIFFESVRLDPSFLSSVALVYGGAMLVATYSRDTSNPGASPKGDTDDG